MSTRIAALIALAALVPVTSSAADGGLPALLDDPSSPLALGPGMTRPELVSGKLPKYSPEAITAGVKGTSMVSCIVTLEGRTRECRVVQPIRFRKAQVEASNLEQAALAFLEEEARFKPATFKGRPQAVRCTFVLTFNPPAKPEDPAFVIK